MKFEAILSLNLTEGLAIPTSFPLVKDNKHYGYVAVYLDPQNNAVSEEIQTNCSLVENTLACTLQIDCFKPTKDSVKQASAFAKMKTTFDPFLGLLEEKNSGVMDLTKNVRESTQNITQNSELPRADLSQTKPADKLETFPEIKTEISQPFEKSESLKCADINGNVSPISKPDKTSVGSISSTASTPAECKTEEDPAFPSESSFNDRFAEQSTTYVVLIDGSYKCRLCDKRFSNKNSIWQHRKTVHELQRFHCQVCTRKFTRKAMLDAHLLKCTNRTMTSFSASELVKRENEQDSEPKPLDLCLESSFKTSPLTNSPKQNFGSSPLHLRPKPYNCHFCQKKLRSVRARNRHHFKCKLNPLAMQGTFSPPEHKKPHLEITKPKKEANDPPSTSTGGYIGLLQAAPRYSNRTPSDSFMSDTSTTQDSYSSLCPPANSQNPLFPLSGYLGPNQQRLDPMHQFSQMPDKASIEALASSLFPKTDPFSQALAAANLLAASYDATVRQVAQNAAVQNNFSAATSSINSVTNPFLQTSQFPEKSEWKSAGLAGN